jgi:hypothetical protein
MGLASNRLNFNNLNDYLPFRQVPEGYSTRKWLNDKISEPVGEPSLVRYIHESAEFHKEFKVRYFMLKAYNGVACGKAKKHKKFRWFTLTESDEAIESKIDFGVVWHKFVGFIRYYCPDFEYIVVEHRQGDKKRLNRHVMCYGTDKLPWLKMREYWETHYKSYAMACEEIRNIDKSIKYLAGYLSEDDKYVRSFCSQNWVYPGWLGIGKNANKEFGRYPTKSETVSIALMDSETRESVPAVCAYRINKSVKIKVL